MIRLGNYGTPLELGEDIDFEGEVLFGNLTAMGEFILPLAVELVDDVRCRTPFMYNDTFTPEMTSNTLPSGNVTSASNVYTSDYAAWKAFDHSIANDDAWMTQTGVTTGWVQIQLASGKVARKYTIYDRRYDINQDAGGASYAPYTWDFQGSNNGSNWTTLDSQDNITWDLDEQEAKTFEFDNAISYTYYRINVTANNGGGRLAIGEIYIYDEMSDPPLQVSALSNISDIISISFTRSSEALYRSIEEAFVMADTIVTEATTTLSDILNIQDLSIPLFIKLNEILTLAQVPFETTYHTLTEQGYERASTALTETGDFIYSAISESGRELLTLAHQHGLQVLVTTRKSDNVRINSSINAGFEFVILNVLTLGDTCLSNMSFFLNEILSLVEALPIRAKTYGTVESLTLTGMSTFGSMRYLLDRIDMIGTKRVYPTTSILNEIVANDTYKVVVNISPLTELINFTDTAVGSLSRFMLEQINIIGTKATIASRTLTAETINVIDTIYSSGTQILSEILTLSDSILRTVTTNRSDVINLERPVISRNVSTNIPLHTIILPDILTRGPSVIFTEILNVIDSTITPLLTKRFTEVVSLVMPLKLPSQVSKTFSELMNVIDVGMAGAIKPLPESITFTDSIIIPPFTRVLVEVLRLIDSPRKLLEASRTESITISDTLLPGIINYIFVEILNVSSTLNPTSILAYLSENLNIRGAFNRNVNLVGVEVLNVIDSISHIGASVNLVDEIFNVIDTRMTRVSKTPIETIRVGDSRWRTVLTYRDEVITLLDTFYSVFGILLTETIQFGDSILKRPAPYMIEKLYFLPRLNRQYEQMLTEVINFSDSLTNVPSYILVELIEFTQSFNTSLSIYQHEHLSLAQTISKRSMKYQDVETVAVSDTYHVSALSVLIAETLTVVDSTYRSVFRTMNEIVKILDEKCAKRVSFVAQEIVAMIDLRNATLDQSLQEVILVSDSIKPSMMLVRLEALLVSNTITRYVIKLPFEEVINVEEITLTPTIGRILEEIMELGSTMGNTLVEYTLVKELVVVSAERVRKTIVYSAFEEVLTITSSIGRRIVSVSPLVDSLIISSEMGSTTIVLRAFEEVIAIAGTTNKIVHDIILALETISIADSPKEWYNNIVHRLESVVKQVTKIRTSSRTDKEKSIKKITKDSKRE